MKGIEKLEAIEQVHNDCSPGQARAWMVYWVEIYHADYGLAELCKLKDQVDALYKKHYYEEEREDAKYDMMEDFNHEEEEDD